MEVPLSIHRHSADDSFFIYCVGQSIPVINAFKATMAQAGIPVKPLMGKYKGKPEYSFISRMADYPTIAPWLDEEESILYLHDYDSRDRPRATLRFLKEGRDEDLGRLVPVSRLVAVDLDAYTFDPQQNQYFICIMVK